MKKALLILLVLFSSMAFVMAETSVSADETLDQTGKSAEMIVSLNLENAESFLIGFSKDGNRTDVGQNDYSGTLELTVDGSTANNNDNNLYVWWDITATKGYSVDLSATKLMISGQSGEPNEIDIFVKGEQSDNSGDVVAIDTSTSIMSDNILTVEQSQTIATKKGSQKLSITTEDLNGKTVSSTPFTGTLTLKIAAT